MERACLFCSLRVKTVCDSLNWLHIRKTFLLGLLKKEIGMFSLEQSSKLERREWQFPHYVPDLFSGND